MIKQPRKPLVIFCNIILTSIESLFASADSLLVLCIIQAGDNNVRVVVRCRPFNSREKEIGDINSCITIGQNHLDIKKGSNPADHHHFAFDVLFDENCLQQSVWESVGLPILDKAFEGYNGMFYSRVFNVSCILACPRCSCFYAVFDINNDHIGLVRHHICIRPNR